MRFEPRTLSLRNDRRVLLRTSTYPGAAPGLLALERAIVRARVGIVKYEDELPTDAETYAKKQVDAGLGATDGSAFGLVAEEEGRGIVAEASLLRFHLRMLWHVGVLGIGVHPEAQGIGLGRAMLEALLGWVRSHRDEDGERVRRVELNVLADNTRAIALYRSLGFVEEGRRRAFIRRGDGSFGDDLTMGLFFVDEADTPR